MLIRGVGDICLVQSANGFEQPVNAIEANRRAQKGGVFCLHVVTSSKEAMCCKKPWFAVHTEPWRFRRAPNGRPVPHPFGHMIFCIKAFWAKRSRPTAAANQSTALFDAETLETLIEFRDLPTRIN